MKKVIPTTSASPLTPEQQAELVSLEQAFGTIHTIAGTDAAGKPVVSFLKKLGYDTKKKVLVMLMKDADKTIEAGEIIYLDCYVGGTNLYEDEDTRLEGALQAFELFSVNDSIQMLKKN